MLFDEQVDADHQPQKPRAHCSPGLFQPNMMLVHLPLNKSWAGLSRLWTFVPAAYSAYHNLPHPSLPTDVGLASWRALLLEPSVPWIQVLCVPISLSY